jgi:hypothetical protein
VQEGVLASRAADAAGRPLSKRPRQPPPTPRQRRSVAPWILGYFLGSGTLGAILYAHFYPPA